MNTKRRLNGFALIEIFILIAIIGILAALMLPCAARAQDNPPAPPTPPAAIPSGGLLSVGETALHDLQNATNYAVAPYVTYGLDNHKVGGGVLALYNFNSFIGAGIGADYLGQFSAISGNLQLKLPLRPLAFTGWGWATNLVTTPFAWTGIGTPMSGAGGNNGGISTHIGGGLNVDVAKLGGGEISVGGAIIDRTGAGSYSGKYVNGFLAWRKGF
jgi:hypothetical protein